MLGTPWWWHNKSAETRRCDSNYVNYDTYCGTRSWFYVELIPTWRWFGKSYYKESALGKTAHKKTYDSVHSFAKVNLYSSKSRVMALTVTRWRRCFRRENTLKEWSTLYINFNKTCRDLWTVPAVICVYTCTRKQHKLRDKQLPASTSQHTHMCTCDTCTLTSWRFED